MKKSEHTWRKSLKEASETLHRFSDSRELIESCGEFSALMVETYRAEGSVFACGNGGSHCDAMHFAEEMTGRFFKDRRPLGALALGDAAHMSCVANDFGFEHVFSRQLEGLGRKGDLLIAISTSGQSKNVMNAVTVAQAKGIKTVGLLGKDGGALKGAVDVAIVVPSQNTGRIQEMHIKILHIVIETLERELFPQFYQQS